MRRILVIVCLLLPLAVLAQERFNVMNPAVQEYFRKSNASFSSEPGNFSNAFFDQKFDYRPDRPVSKTVSVACRNAGKVIISVKCPEDSRQSFKKTVLCDSDEYSFVLTNLVPGFTYKYKVRQGLKVLAEDSLVAEGPVRMITLEKGFNIRDLGGWTGLDGKTVKYGQLYRGGSLGGTDMDGNRSGLPQEDKDELLRLGVLAHLDLRAETNGGLYPREVSLHSYSIGETTFSADFNNTRTDNGAYNRDGSVISDVAWIIYELRRGKPVYFNCRQGADRTGTVAFVLEGLLGCYEYRTEAGGNQMAMDYELTGFSGANYVDNRPVRSSARPARDAFGNPGKLFRQLIELEAAESDIRLETLQQRCYYYLNRYTGLGDPAEWPHIDSADLDWFIRYMLGMSAAEYASFRPSWAQSGGNLKQIGESHANVVKYISE